MAEEWAKLSKRAQQREKKIIVTVGEKEGNLEAIGGLERQSEEQRKLTAMVVG